MSIVHDFSAHKIVGVAPRPQLARPILDAHDLLLHLVVEARFAARGPYLGPPLLIALFALLVLESFRVSSSHKIPSKDG